jgi:hypothetical protein
MQQEHNKVEDGVLQREHKRPKEGVLQQGWEKSGGVSVATRT